MALRVSIECCLDARDPGPAASYCLPERASCRQKKLRTPCSNLGSTESHEEPETRLLVEIPGGVAGRYLPHPNHRDAKQQSGQTASIRDRGW